LPIIAIENLLSGIENGKKYADGMISNITGKKNFEAQLSESEEKFRTISEQAIMQIVILQDDLIKYKNQAFLDFLGYTDEEIDSWKPKEVYNIIYLQIKKKS